MTLDIDVAKLYVTPETDELMRNLYNLYVCVPTVHLRKEIEVELLDMYSKQPSFVFDAYLREYQSIRELIDFKNE